MSKSFARSRLSQVTIATVPATVRWFLERYDGAAQIQLAMEKIELKYGFYEDFDWDQFGLGITITGDSYEGYDLGSTVLGGSDRELGQFNASLDNDMDFRIVIYSDSDDDSHGNWQESAAEFSAGVSIEAFGSNPAAVVQKPLH